MQGTQTLSQNQPHTGVAEWRRPEHARHAIRVLNAASDATDISTLAGRGAAQETNRVECRLTLGPILEPTGG